MGSQQDTTIKRGWLSFPLTGQVAHSADDAGSVGYIQNPEDVPIIVTRCVVYGITNSTGACDLTIGNAATVADAHDRTDEFAAAAQAASAGTAVEGLAHGDAADALPVVPADDYICGFCSANSSGYTGVAYLEYLKVI